MIIHRHIPFHVAAAAATRRSMSELTPPPPVGTEMSKTAYSILLAFFIAFFATGCILVLFRKALTHACCGIDQDQFVDDDLHTGAQRSSSDGLSRENIDKFPLYHYSDVKSHQLGTGELECAICLNQFVDKEKLRLLPRCNHVFHPQCIDRWLQSQATCPVCRTDYHHSQSRSSSPDNLLLELEDEEDEILSSGHGSIITHSPDQITTVHDDHTQEQQPQQRLHWPVRSSSVSSNFPKFHSTGHSPFWTAEENERFTLRLSVESRSKLAVSGRWRWSSNNSNGGGHSQSSLLPQMASPRDTDDVSLMIDKRLLDLRIKSERLGFSSNSAVGSDEEVSRPGSPKSDGVVDYSSLVTGAKDVFQVSM